MLPTPGCLRIATGSADSYRSQRAGRLLGTAHCRDETTPREPPRCGGAVPRFPDTWPAPGSRDSPRACDRRSNEPSIGTRPPDRALVSARTLGGPAKTLLRRLQPQAAARPGRPAMDAGIPGADEVDAPIHSADELHRPEESWREL